ncbi:hypothetical protein [Micromonospora sp. DT31]|uniref:hypothetical protein n=1 Tax=Micromonospora sp. DT31 TaxID=3393434 RepID=UPI003CF14761
MTEPPGRGRRRGAAVATLVVIAGASACADHPVSPLPVRPPAAGTVAAAPTSTAPAPPAGTSSTPAPPVSTGPARAPSRAAPPNPPTRSRPPSAPRTPRPAGTTPPAACHGPVRYDLVLADTELALVRSLCFAAGGVLRIQGIGPGEVTVDREDLVSRTYEAGVVDIRFVRTGTVVVTIPQDGRAYPITVVVV